MKYYIGIDGGGTHSRMLVTDENLSPMLRVDGRSTNPASNSMEFVSDTLDALFGELQSIGLEKENCIGLCIGSAGLNCDADCNNMQELIRSSAGFGCPITAVNDSLLALYAAFLGKSGVVLVCGTGSIALGMDIGGKAVRSGGWGHLTDDHGSAYWIGKEAIRRAFCSYDGRGDKTVLEDVLKQLYDVGDLAQVANIINSTETLNKSDIAKLSQVVEECALRGDSVCTQILRDAAHELVILISAVMNVLEINTPRIVVSGGVIENNDILFGLLEDEINVVYPGISIEKIEKEPIWGAIYFAAKASQPHIH